MGEHVVADRTPALERDPSARARAVAVGRRSERLISWIPGCASPPAVVAPRPEKAVLHSARVPLNGWPRACNGWNSQQPQGEDENQSALHVAPCCCCGHAAQIAQV